jgi:hypothetical protein
VKRPLPALILALASVSPPVLFGLERGNTDLLIFCGVIGVTYRDGVVVRRRRVVTAAGVAILTLLKIYPIVLLASFVRDRRWVTAMAAIGAAIGGLMWQAGDNLPFVFSNTQIGPWRSHGAMVILLQTGLELPGALIESHATARTGHYAPMFTMAHVSWPGGLQGLRLAAMVLVGGLSVILAGVTVRGPALRRYLPRYAPETPHGRAAMASALISCTSFFVFGSNFDYRLIFLLPCIVGSLEQFERESDSRQLVLPVLTAMFMWISPFGTLWEDAVGWLVMTALLAVIFAEHAPRSWLRQ